MKANELRIGNWVMYEGNKYQVLADDFGWLQYDNHEATPIPLTPEILEKAGFEKREWLFFNQNFYDKKPLTYDCTDGRIYYESDETDEIGEKYGVNFYHIKSLHSLQNLIFALTGEELDIAF